MNEMTSLGSNFGTSLPAGSILEERINTANPAVMRLINNLAENLTPNSTVSQASLISGIDEVLHISEDEIETQVDLIEYRNTLIDSAFEMELITQSYPEISVLALNDVIGILEATLPPHIFQVAGVEQTIKITKEIANLGSMLLISLSIGSQLIEIICKQKMIDQSRSLLELLESSFKSQLEIDEQADVHKIGAEEKDKNEELFKEWKEKLNIQENKLSQEKKGVVFNTAFGTVYGGLEFAKLFSLTSTTLSILGVFSHLLIFTFNQFGFVQALLNSSKFENWQQAYQRWRIKKTDFVDKNLSQNVGFNQELSGTEKVEKEVLSSITTDLYGINSVSSDEEFVEKSLNALDSVIKTSKNLLHKREALTKKKHLLISVNYQKYESKIKERNRAIYISSHAGEINFLASNDKISIEEATNILFEIWFASKPKERMIQNYIDHQQCFEQTLKNSLKEVVQHKFNVEKNFFTFEKVSKGITTMVCLLGLCSSIALLIGGIITFPTGIGILFLLASLTPAGISLGITLTGLLLRLHQKPHITKSLTYPPRLAFYRFGEAFAFYRQMAQQKKLFASTKILGDLYFSRGKSSALDESWADYQKVQADFKQSEKKLANWSQKLAKLEREYALRGWKDFTKKSSLMESKDPQLFDSLRAFTEALLTCDFSLLSSETKMILENQLGINLKKLQDATADKSEEISFALQKYAGMNHQELILFIKEQEQSILL